MKRYLLLSVLLTAVPFATQSAEDATNEPCAKQQEMKKGQGHRKINFDELSKAVGLDSTQAEQLKSLMSKHRTEKQLKRKEKRQANKAMKKEMKEGKKAAKAQHRKELSAILDEKQMELFRQYMKSHKPKK